MQAFDSRSRFTSLGQRPFVPFFLIDIFSSVQEEIAWASTWAHAHLVCAHFDMSLFPDIKAEGKHSGGKLRLSLPSVQALAGIYLSSCPISQTPSWCLPEDLSCKTSGKIPAAAPTLQKMWFVDRHSGPLSELWANKSVSRQQPSKGYYFCYVSVILILYPQVLTLHRYLFKREVLPGDEGCYYYGESWDGQLVTPGCVLDMLWLEKSSLSL